MLLRGEKPETSWWYPDEHEKLAKGHARWRDIHEYILPRLADSPKRICVQAGGAVGVWPITFAGHFDQVMSFEPNPVLRECFERNIEDRKVHNVHIIPKGLWDSEGTASLSNPLPHPHNKGAWFLDLDGDDFEITYLDKYNLTDVDLIQWDIEGAELWALEGGKETIERCRPMIVLENKVDAVRNFHTSVEAVHDKMHDLGYDHVFSYARDEIWMPK